MSSFFSTMRTDAKKVYRKIISIVDPSTELPKNKYAKFLNAEPNDAWKKNYASYRVSMPIEENWVFYESHGGSGMLCNPLAIFKAFQKAPEFNAYLHIWVVRDAEEKARLEEEHQHLNNVIFVYYLSSGYAYFLAKSKYLINNTSFNSVFSKREDQVYLNTWHSITVKALGYDMPDGRRLVNNMLRNLLMSDYVISPNRFMTDIFNNAFRLKEIFPNKFLEIGYPRNDLVVNSDRETVFKKMERRGTVVDRTKKVILYAPTWNGNNVGKPKIDVARYSRMCEYFSEHIDMNEYQLLIKPHQIEYRNFTQEERDTGKYVSYTIDANELLSVVDILITDYSSIYFDYMMADKPILFYMPDFEAYSKTRGIYFTKEELPGPCCSDLSDLAEHINNIGTVTVNYQEIRDNTKAWACEFDDSHVAEKVLDIVFRGNTNYNIKGAVRTEKQRLLMYIGTLATNGVTSAALSLLNTIDYEKFDVTVFAVSLKSAEQNINFDKIPAKVRTVLRTSAPKLPKEYKAVYTQMLTDGIPADTESRNKLQAVMRSEFMRTFGEASFEYIIDFSGYGLYFPSLAFLGNPDTTAKRYMWQHSDMYTDYTNEEKKALNNNNISVDALISCYNLADKVVSATKDVYVMNKRNLSTPETESKFTYVTNLMDADRVNALLHDDNVEVHDDHIVYIKNQLANGIKDITIIPFNSNAINFVAMGRYMPEKNHANIIRAIKRLNDEGHNAAIYIIGDGHLRAELEALAAELGIADKVYLTGILQNPFALLKKCDCFVFPSIYEAQGLAVLEARTVGLPIIVSNYEAVSSVLLDDQQYILQNTDSDSIYEGMMAFINGKIPAEYTFSIEEYNKMGIAEFSKLLN